MTSQRPEPPLLMRTVAALACLFAGVSMADVGRAPPAQLAQPDRDATYLIYLHGQIVEDRGPRPTHPRFGLYDFPAVVDALAARGAVVVAEQRPAGTIVRREADRIRMQIQALIDAGVPPERIAVVGFSKGGAIAMLAASGLSQPVRLGLLASCWSGMRGVLRVSAHVLSIFERSDELAGSCSTLFASDPPPASFMEQPIDLGRGHGAFYLPHREWIGPLLDWVHAPTPATVAADRHAQR